MTIYILTLENRYGTEAFAFTTQEAASAKLDAYVAESWAKKMGDEPMPEDAGEAVERYFEGNEREDYEFLDAELELPEAER